MYVYIYIYIYIGFREDRAGRHRRVVGERRVAAARGGRRRRRGDPLGGRTAGYHTVPPYHTVLYYTVV